MLQDPDHVNEDCGGFKVGAVHMVTLWCCFQATNSSVLYHNQLCILDGAG